MNKKRGGFRPNMKSVVEGKKEFLIWIEDLIDTNPSLEESRDRIATIVLIAINKYLKEKTYYGTKKRVKDKLIRLVTSSFKKEFPGIVIKEENKESG